MENKIEITKNAQKHIASILTAENSKYFRKHLRFLQFVRPARICQCTAGGKPSTWFPPGGLVEQSGWGEKQNKTQRHEPASAQITKNLQKHANNVRNRTNCS